MTMTMSTASATRTAEQYCTFWVADLFCGVAVDVDYRGQLPIVAQYKGKAIVAESDADTAHDTLRETLRLRPQVLRRLGWHYIRVHAFDLYSDPAGVAERIAAILGVAPEGGAVDTVTQPIDVLD